MFSSSKLSSCLRLIYHVFDGQKNLARMIFSPHLCLGLWVPCTLCKKKRAAGCKSPVFNRYHTLYNWSQKNPDVVLFLASRKEITSWKDWWCHLDEPRQLFPLLYSLEERAPYGRRTSLPIGCGVVVFLTHVVWSTKCFLEAPILPGPTLIILNKHAYTYW